MEGLLRREQIGKAMLVNLAGRIRPWVAWDHLMISRNTAANASHAVSSVKSAAASAVSIGEEVGAAPIFHTSAAMTARIESLNVSSDRRFARPATCSSRIR